MAISPTLSACFKENNTLLQLTDTTGTYSAGNTGGYGSPNDASTDITSATVLITFPDESTQTVDVTLEINDGVVVGNYIFTDVTPDSTADGVYSFLYTIVSPSGTVTYRLSKLFLGNVRCCIDKMQVEVSNHVCDECETSEYIKKVDLAEGLYNSLLAMGGCYKLGSITKVLTKLQNICIFEECNCN